MPYANADEVLKLATKLQGTAEGLTIDEIAREMGCGRRKAERLRDKVRDLFSLDSRDDIDDVSRRAVRRWRLRPGSTNHLLALSANELAALDAAAELAKREGLTEQADLLKGVSIKVRAILRPERLRAVEMDLELLTEVEGLAMRPGPRLHIDSAILGPLREAILGSRIVRIRYRARGTGKFSWNRVEPYGFLYGNRHFLVAWTRELNGGWRLFRLSRISEVQMRDEWFERDPNFSLREFAKRSFGVFQEEPFDVVWRFKPEVAEDAREYVFHPTQTMEDQPDGSLIVRFQAGGRQEMDWHLYTWGDAVEVLQPTCLRRKSVGPS